jgi:hypothetical protein
MNPTPTDYVGATAHQPPPTGVIASIVLLDSERVVNAQTRAASDPELILHAPISWRAAL